VVALEELRHHASELAERTGVRVDVEQEGPQVFVIMRDLPLPCGAYRVGRADVLFITDTQYPLSAMDMFWTDEAVLRADGAIPAGAESIETYRGRRWRRFSWHRNGLWSPTGNCLLDHFEFMQDRFVRELVS
jgi:hypothetical protein